MTETAPLRFHRSTIRQIARERLGGQTLFGIVARQAWSEGRLLLARHVNFRKRQNELAREAYCAMDIEEFEGINARQKWANWRTIPRSLDGILPSRPLVAIDLCCGVGHSTEVLSFYLPRGSSVLGLEYNEAFVRTARGKTFPDRDGNPVPVRFNAQSVLETFRDDRGERVPDASVDLVNSSGAVGSHFDTEATTVLTREIARVLKPGGIATIDSGLPGTKKAELTRIFASEGFETVRSAKSSVLDLFTQICFRRR